jgi:hypothetical protein
MAVFAFPLNDSIVFADDKCGKSKKKLRKQLKKEIKDI